MKKLAFLLLLLPSLASAEKTKLVFNPFTGKFDYITTLDTNSIQAGSGVTVSTTSNGVSISATGSSSSNTNTYSSSVTFQGGIDISSGIVVNASVITSTTVLTSTMSFVLASCTTRGASPNANITLTLPPAKLINGVKSSNIGIYDVGIDSCSLEIVGSGTDVIYSTGMWRLDAQNQYCELKVIGNGVWGGDCQATPASIFSTQDDVGTFTVGTASDVYSCPIYIPVPIGFMGFRFGRSTGGGIVGHAITDMFGKYIVGVSSEVTISGMNNYFSGGVTPLSPGWYRGEVVIPNTITTLNGSNSVGSSKAFCSKVGTSTTGSDLSGFSPTLPGTGDSRPYPAFNLLFNGGMQSY